MHAEAAGYGKQWSLERGGAWVVHHSEITYRRPAVYGDEVEVNVRVELLKGARGVRRTFIRRLPDGEVLCELLVEWAWVRVSDGRPMRIPKELAEIAQRNGL
jgi:acyl-CoA thioesterase FadM